MLEPFPFHADRKLLIVGESELHHETLLYGLPGRIVAFLATEISCAELHKP